ncbi:MAG: hypothetical protein ABGU97_11225 [Xylella fastidiosa subsp. multiplex]|uniref:hypothetical protein n=1 Tax=Xylella fastidiosa TaxID=2371 RepID=UPI001F443729|nr:hypothetical protein [Xylella fastidiosa]UIT46822.1 hypothetical protein LZ754_06270 [Xylella fastidiosa subsp. multiplex]
MGTSLSRPGPSTEVGGGGGGALGPLSGGVEGEGSLRVMNTTHALTAVINAAKQSMGIWVLSNDICYLLAPAAGCGCRGAMGRYCRML